MLFAALLRSSIRSGSMEVVDHAGRRHRVGEDGAPGPVIRLTRRSLGTTLALNPKLSIGEAYADGTLVVEQGSLVDFLTLLARNLDTDGWSKWVTGWGYWTGRVAARLQRSNRIARSARNAAYHYDLSPELYDLFLDTNRQYSCAYFVTPDDSLEIAQEQKMRHIAAKLLLDRPGLRVLDVGSGWGGLACYLAKEAGADVTGITLSAVQQSESAMRARQAGLDGQVRFRISDYREERAQYDRIVSVGMFEHVGRGSYLEFFAQIRELLRDDGVALIHSIGDSAPPSPINPFVRKYIFPGAAVPSLSEALSAVERSGLVVTDIEILRLHYAETLSRWRERFVARRREVIGLYGEHFFRMWEFYLALCEVGFRHRSSMVFQMQLAKRNDVVPLTRDYMLDRERQMAAVSSGTYDELYDASPRRLFGSYEQGADHREEADPVRERSF